MLMRYRALQSRRSGTLIAKLLLQTQNDSAQSKRLEAAVTDGIRYLGFDVEPLGASGEPEGIARAFAAPVPANPTAQAPRQPLDTFTYDAKSSKHDVSATGNINHAGIAEHRDRYKADHALVVAPGYSEGAMTRRCEQQKIAPMTARDLGRLLDYTVQFGAIPVTKLREVLQIYNPKAVETWVTGLEGWIRAQRPLTIDIFIKALELLRGNIPDALSASVISYACRETLQALSVKDADVIALAKGLAILIPDLVGVEGDKIIINASPNHVADAIRKQLEALHSAAADTGKFGVIRSIHPFPARMAPDLAMERLKNIRRGALVLDPMAGSGTVLRQATELGHRALGFDTDPLAVLMAKVWTRPLDGAAVDRLTDQVIAEARGADAAARPLGWIDDDPETAAFVEYWFADPQRSDLRRLAGALARQERKRSSSGRKAAADALRLALSRIIITKDQGISLARDTSHSRPHKVADASSVAVFSAFERSVRQLRRFLEGAPPKGGCEVGLGDARALRSVENGAIDAVLTSPPYLNAIDYMRGHRLSLVWLGYRLSDLRKIRSDSIGAERGADQPWAAGLFDGMLEAMGAGDSMSGRHRGMVERYCEDVYRLMSEMARVLKPEGKAILIVGNSCLKGQFIRNSEGVTRAGKMVGLRLRAKVERELPHRNRYLPMLAAGEGPLGKRMRTETILTFSPA